MNDFDDRVNDGDDNPNCDHQIDLSSGASHVLVLPLPAQLSWDDDDF